MNLFSNIFSVSSARKEHERNNMYIIYRLPIIPLHCEDAPSPLTFPKCTIDPRQSWSLASSACRIFNICSILSGKLSFSFYASLVYVSVYRRFSKRLGSRQTSLRVLWTLLRGRKGWGEGRKLGTERVGYFDDDHFYDSQLKYEKPSWETRVFL